MPGNQLFVKYFKKLNQATNQEVFNYLHP